MEENSCLSLRRANCQAQGWPPGFKVAVLCVTGAHGRHLANCHVEWYESNIYYLISMTLLWPMSTDFDHSIIGIREEFESWMSIKKHPKVPINWATRLLIIDDISNGHCNHDNNEYQC